MTVVVTVIPQVVITRKRGYSSIHQVVITRKRGYSSICLVLVL